MKPTHFTEKKVFKSSITDDSKEKNINNSMNRVRFYSKKEDRPRKYKSEITKAIFCRFLSKLNNGCVVLQEKDNVKIFGDKQSDIKVKLIVFEPRVYRNIILKGSIGAAESYTEGLWTTDNLTGLIQIFCRNLSHLNRYEKIYNWLTGILAHIQHHILSQNNRSGSRTNIAAHYDLSNELYQLFLDTNMQYSSAIFSEVDITLEQAQEHKMHILCSQLELTANDHLLEIGTGWGTFACFAAQNYNCRVTATTISREQFKGAQRQVIEKGLQDKVTLLFKDYRDLRGKYSKIVSVEMIEAVGYRFMPDYFRMLNNLLIDGGKLLIQAITIEDQRYDSYRKNVDFIQRYIFPGGHLPAISELLRHVKEQTTMRLNHFSDFSHHYAKTLKIWNERFTSQREKILKLGFNEDFIRLWQYYFSYCEGAFRESVIGLVHIKLIKSKYP